MKAERPEKQSSQPLENSFYLYRILTLKGQFYFYKSSDCYCLYKTSDFIYLYESSDCLLRLHLSSCLLPPYIPLSTQPYCSCLHLPNAGIKGVGLQVQGSPLCELCFSLRQIQPPVAQGGPELREMPLSLSPRSWD